MANRTIDSKSAVKKTILATKTVNDMFDIPDDTNDGLQFSTDVLNQYYLVGRLSSTTYVEETMEHDLLNDSDYIELSELTTKTSEEVQVTTSVEKTRHASSTTSPSVYPKRIKMIGSNDDEDDATFEIDMKKDQTPYYLSLNNKLFLRTSKDILKNVQTITINDIQQIAILMHQIGALKIKIDQTNIYLKAVTGTLTEPESDLIDVDRRVWPMQVQSMMSSKRESNSVTTTESNHENTQRDCENLLHQRLQETSQQIQGFEQELTEKKQTFFEFTSTMNDAIQKYVQDYGIKSMELTHNFKKAIVSHD
ncbi:unnamed protein product [Rotaria sp. Silwood1]|nr:unnamed protein product [Rotaria sp. Silwood1]